MAAPTPNEPYEPYRSHATGRWDPARTMPRVNENANGHAQSHAHGPLDEPFVVPPPPPIPITILPGGKHALSGVAARAFGLGLGLGLSIISAITLAAYDQGVWRLPFFFASLAIFHFFEFYTTARYNTGEASLSAFLLTSNGTAYNVAHALAAVETTLSHSVFSYPVLIPAVWRPLVLLFGLILMVVGQSARSIAMSQAGTNFNHTVQSKRKTGHELVTTGIYSVLRHPSYFGFFWWSLGGQIVLGNPVCFAAYAVILWRFFNGRIKTEEKFLINFFGDSYTQYRQKSVVGIPFIS